MNGGVRPSLQGEVRGVRRGRLTVTKLHRSGTRPVRLLLLGSRALLCPVGHAQVEALGARITDRVWLRTQRGVDLDMVWELRPALQAMGGTLMAWRLWRYDAVVLVSPARPRGVAQWWAARGIANLLQPVVREAAKASFVLVVSLEGSGVSQSRHRGQSECPSASAGGGSDRVRQLSTSQDGGIGADAIAQQLLDPLTEADAGGVDGRVVAAHRLRRLPDEEVARQRALDDLELDARRLQRRLQHVVDVARETFESASAEITILDHDRQWTLVAAGAAREDHPRSTSLCNRAIRTRDATLIADTWRVPDLRGNPLVAGADPIRFYAAHPIESVDGYRIGVLCVWDDVPHQVDAFDVSALRDLALLAEAEIIDC